ncbi:alpha/beta fold hydrolase [Paenibacillus aquistagni]|uniref:Pimeloyl-ACP methyl ester carboxylesterase n=1 Tax=Paenibacillus aquistagni TaxID=1852522 RepID=A0A1X7LFC1_9BACL|nr:alpha/beta fold hydrolase [Paenibacillus aquistagni]SMG51879.1 Pimeloyl-ACP methyl ester carboxylesterase [Paenibacillus aquistagni]
MNIQLIWIHGWGASPAVWDIGHGSRFSSRAENCDAKMHIHHRDVSLVGCTTIEDMLATVTSAFDEAAKREQPWHVIGWSLGGMLAIDALLRWMKQQPCSGIGAHELHGASTSGVGSHGLHGASTSGMLPASLIGVGATCQFVDEQGHAGWRPRILERMRRKLERAPEQVLADFADQFWSPTERADERYLTWQTEMSHVIRSAGYSLEGLNAGLQYLQQAALEKQLIELAHELPILWVQGSEDQICPAAAMEQWNEVPLHTVRFSGAGHAPFLTRKEQWEAVLRQWLWSQCPQRPREGEERESQAD